MVQFFGSRTVGVSLRESQMKTIFLSCLIALSISSAAVACPGGSCSFKPDTETPIVITKPAG